MNARYNSRNQLTSFISGTNTVSFAYNDNGNRMERIQGAATDAYTWDYENRLVALDKESADGVGTYGWAYDYRTRRVELAYAGDITKVVFSGGTSVREFENSVASVDYVRGSDWGGGVGGILYSLRGGVPSFTHYNRRGDVTVKTDGTGAVTYQATYEAFGKRATETGATLDRQKSNTKDEDIPGYANEGFRFRDLETDVFLSKDPAGFVDGPNLYAYVVQNPWTKFDPEGLFWAEIGDFAVGTAVGGMEVASGQTAPASPNNSSANGRAFGRSAATMGGVYMAVDGAAKIGGGGATLAVAGFATAGTGGAGTPITGPVALGAAAAMGVGGVEAAAGGMLMSNAAKLGSITTESGAADGSSPSGSAKETKVETDQKTHQTYTKTNPETGEVYTGKTSGEGTPLENIAARDANHHMTEKGFGPAKLDKSSASKDAIRGREQPGIDANGRAKSEGGSSGNAIRGVAKKNPKAKQYQQAAKKEFGD